MIFPPNSILLLSKRYGKKNRPMTIYLSGTGNLSWYHPCYAEASLNTFHAGITSGHTYCSALLPDSISLSKKTASIRLCCKCSHQAQAFSDCIFLCTASFLCTPSFSSIVSIIIFDVLIIAIPFLLVKCYFCPISPPKEQFFEILSPFVSDSHGKNRHESDSLLLPP